MLGGLCPMLKSHGIVQGKAWHACQLTSAQQQTPARQSRHVNGSLQHKPQSAAFSCALLRPPVSGARYAVAQNSLHGVMSVNRAAEASPARLLASMLVVGCIARGCAVIYIFARQTTASQFRRLLYLLHVQSTAQKPGSQSVTICSLSPTGLRARELDVASSPIAPIPRRPNPH